MLRIQHVGCCSVILVMSLVQSSSLAELVAHWPLNEVDTDVFAELVAGNDGFLPADSFVEFIDNDGPPGIFDHSVLFTGDEGPSFIETPFVGIGGADPRTITLWAKADPQTRNTGLVAWGPNVTGEKWHFRIENTFVRTEFSGGQNFGATNVADGEWHHLVAIFPDGGFEGDDIIHYVDGEVEPKEGGTSIPIDTGIDPDAGAFPVHIGYAIPHAGRWFQGQIADVRIYDEELDQDTIQGIMAGAGLVSGGTPGDFNDDGVIDLADFGILRDNFGGAFSRDEAPNKGDFTGDLRVNLKDFRDFRNAFNAAGAPVAAAVPEPSSFPSLALAGALLLTIRRRR